MMIMFFVCLSLPPFSMLRFKNLNGLFNCVSTTGDLAVGGGRPACRDRPFGRKDDDLLSSAGKNLGKIVTV
jgi:hypothetical protein